MHYWSKRECDNECSRYCLVSSWLPVSTLIQYGQKKYTKPPLMQHLPTRVLEHEPFEYHKAAYLSYIIPQTWIIYSIESLNWTAWVLVAIDSSWWIGDGINRKLITWVTRLRRSYSPNYYNSSRYQLKKSGLEPIRSKQLLTESWMVWKSTTDSITLRCITAKLLGEDPELGGARPLLILLTSDFCELTWPKGCCSTPSTLCHWNYIRKIASYSSQSHK